MNTGHGPRGEFSERIPSKDLIDNLERIGALIRSSEADVACLQEVDLRWKLTHNINQGEYLKRASGLGFSLFHSHHSSPLPAIAREVLPANVVWNRDLGTAILSRYPIIEGRHYDFGQSLTESKVVNHFAKLLNESKGYTFADIDFAGMEIGVMNVHLLNDIVFQIFKRLGKQIRGETFARVWQVEKVLEHVKEYLEISGNQLIVAGDFNSVPRESQVQYHQSKNGDPDDYRRDMTMYLIRESGLVRTIPELFGKGDERSISGYHTYPGVDPDRVLDYVFVTPGFRFAGYSIIPEAVSDHLAVIATLEIL